MKLNTIVRLPDGRLGTICWNHLDGAGGVWGQHRFAMPEGGFGDELPAPEFMLREKKVEPILRAAGHRADMECVGTAYDVVAVAEEYRAVTNGHQQAKGEPSRSIPSGNEE